jgi:glycosyltransferase involved in cell wall biosynthesis
MKITAIIPTYQRPKDLERCLDAFKKQIRPPDQLLVTMRDTDTKTADFLQSYHIEHLPLRALIVDVTGVVAAMNCALEASTGDIIAFTDDDAAPHVDWLQRIEAYFLSDEHLGGLGGRDWQYVGTKLKETGERRVVGQMRWDGLVIGNHHLGVGEPQEVYVLKGVNMSFRRTAITDLRFDERMRGTGAQVHFELAFSLSLKRAGWKILFDPKVAVDHFPAQRFDEDLREAFSAIALTNQVHNETLALLEYLSLLRRIVFMIVSILISGIKWIRYFPKEGSLSNQKFKASLDGLWQGWRTWQQGQK